MRVLEQFLALQPLGQSHNFYFTPPWNVLHVFFNDLVSKKKQYGGAQFGRATVLWFLRHQLRDKRRKNAPWKISQFFFYTFRGRRSIFEGLFGGIGTITRARVLNIFRDNPDRLYLASDGRHDHRALIRAAISEFRTFS